MIQRLATSMPARSPRRKTSAQATITVPVATT